LRANEVQAIEFEVRNDGPESWPSTGRQMVCASYRWKDDAGTIIVYDGERTALSGDIAPGESARIWCVVKAPAVYGHLTLSMTFVQEYHAWFDEKGALPYERRVRWNRRARIPCRESVEVGNEGWTARAVASGGAGRGR
jgi:hypothetical protein